MGQCDFCYFALFSIFIGFFSNWFFQIFINSRTAIAGAIIGFLWFFISSRPFDVKITLNLLFVRVFMKFRLNCVRDVLYHY